MIQLNQPLLDAKTQYDRDGYCILDDIFSASELQDMEDYFEGYRTRDDAKFEAKGGQWGAPVKLEEVDKTKQPKYAAGQICGNCALFQGKATDAAGGCPLFAGKQVAGKGWCSAYAKKA